MKCKSGLTYHRNSKISTFWPVKSVSVSLIFTFFNLPSLFSQHASARGACILSTMRHFILNFLSSDLPQKPLPDAARGKSIPFLKSVSLLPAESWDLLSTTCFPTALGISIGPEARCSPSHNTLEAGSLQDLSPISAKSHIQSHTSSCRHEIQPLHWRMASKWWLSPFSVLSVFNFFSSFFFLNKWQNVTVLLFSFLASCWCFFFKNTKTSGHTELHFIIWPLATFGLG